LREMDKVTQKRLIYVKRLHMHAQEHVSNGTDFDKMVAVHHLDNAIELLLKCVAASYGISFKNPLKVNFPTLWGRVNDKYKEKQGSELPNKTEVFYIHKIRTDVQHWGKAPFSLDSIKEFDEQTHGFMQSILNTVYGSKYEELSLSSLVKNLRIKSLLFEAERYIQNEKWKEAIREVAIAFFAAKEKMQRRRHVLTVPRLGLGIEGSIVGIEHTLSILALGLDLEDYNKFVENTPAVMFPLREEPVIQWKGEANFTKENTLFCFNFALNSILEWNL